MRRSILTTLIMSALLMGTWTPLASAEHRQAAGKIRPKLQVIEKRLKLVQRGRRDVAAAMLRILRSKPLMKRVRECGLEIPLGWRLQQPKVGGKTDTIKLIGAGLQNYRGDKAGSMGRHIFALDSKLPRENTAARREIVKLFTQGPEILSANNSPLTVNAVFNMIEAHKEIGTP
ncbi:MAG: hypothetical protein JRH20_28345 [Deltaproteobacteria bacterium]|nr:hypothetical protein [Deltaproteobacteria bacterium]